MSINIYLYANLFSTCDENIRKAEESKSSYTTSCNKYENGIQGDIKGQFKEICAQTFSYLNDIELYNHGKNKLKEAHCVYLYYWLYDKYKGKKDSNEIKNLYNKLINVNNTEQDRRCENHNNISISDDEISKLKDIYKIYKNIDKLNGQDTCSQENSKYAQECANIYKQNVESCRQHNKTYFCKELIKIKEQYEKVILNLNCNNDTPKTLPSFQRNNTTVLTLVPVALTILISFFLYVLYKFTPYGSCFRCSRIRKKNKCNNIDHYINTLQLYEISNDNFHNKECNILYSSS
ncbi:variable surface protein [Plasmodium gonderi]|uniref:Variable surface protein n=1 Tax=Plasmodium gonderi TaxID=77519 RepID=A0A1Y1JNS7_PLAGO|nr:variable surface protein [Plasmodium gonderi]GAW84121.1 variable surface protein [Plasmodium gonderi]